MAHKLTVTATIFNRPTNTVMGTQEVVIESPESLEQATSKLTLMEMLMATAVGNAPASLDTLSHAEDTLVGEALGIENGNPERIWFYVPDSIAREAL